MVQTLASSTTPLCPVAEFLKRVDKTAVARLASDDPGIEPTEAELATNVNVFAALLDASGMFESAVMMGQKYSADDLALLYATACGARGLMFRIITDIAWANLYNRRPNMDMPTPASMAQSLQWLDMLSKGHRLLAFEEAAEATVMARIEATDQDLIDRNSSVYQSRAYWGNRSWEPIVTD